MVRWLTVGFFDERMHIMVFYEMSQKEIIDIWCTLFMFYFRHESLVYFSFSMVVGFSMQWWCLGTLYLDRDIHKRFRYWNIPILRHAKDFISFRGSPRLHKWIGEIVSTSVVVHFEIQWIYISVLTINSFQKTICIDAVPPEWANTIFHQIQQLLCSYYIVQLVVVTDYVQSLLYKFPHCRVSSFISTTSDIVNYL